MKYINTIIVGAGISGISLADKLNKNNIENYIFEKNQIGGCIKTSTYKDMWFEMGAHTMYNSYSNIIDFIESNNLENNIISRKKLPFLFVKPDGKIQTILRNINLISLVCSFFKNIKTSKEEKTISNYVTKIFGKSNYNKTLKYCFDAVLSQDSVNFPMKNLFKKYNRNNSFPRSFTFKNGLSTLFKNLKLNIVNENVQNILKDKDHGWIVQTNKNSYFSKNLCLATPWNITENLLKNILPLAVNHPYRPAMSNLSSVAIILNKSALKLKDISGLIGKQQFFYSAISRDVIKHSDLRAITFHCKNNDKTKQELIAKICKLLKIKSNDIFYSKISYNSLPCYNKEHHIFLLDFEKELAKVDGLFIVGNFFDRLAIENCVSRSFSQANKIIQNN